MVVYVPEELVDLTKEISRQNVGSANEFLLAAYEKEKEQRHALRKDLFGFQAEF